MHSLLARQLKKTFGSAEAMPDELQRFIAAVDEAYQQADSDRALLERSTELTSQELIERNDQLRGQQARLEELVKERTATLERRSLQLQAAAEVARDTTAVRELDTLLDRAVNLIRERFGFFHVSIFLVDEPRKYAVMKAATGEAGRRGLAEGFKVALDDRQALVAEVIHSGQYSLVVSGPASPAQPPQASVCSEIALPLTVGGNAIGVLDVRSDQPAPIDENDVLSLQTMTDQLAVAIQNVRLLQEMQQALRELETAYGRYTEESWQTYAAREGQWPGYLYRRLGIERARDLPAEANAALQEGRSIVLAPSAAPAAGGGADDAWQGAVVAVPIKLRDQIIGVINLRLEGGQPSPEAVALVEEMSDRLALALENARLLQETERALAETRRRAEREQRLAAIADRLHAATDVSAVLRIAAEEMRRATGSARAVVRLRSAEPPASVDHEFVVTTSVVRGKRD